MLHRQAETISMGPTPNPWFNIANQFTPRNLHDVIKWSKYIITQSPTLVEVIRKYATYPITEFVIETENEALKAKYEKIIESIRLKAKLCDAGFDNYTIGNVFSSIYFPLDRMLVCNGCKTSFHAKRYVGNVVKFKSFKFQGHCPICKAYNDAFTISDQKSLDIDRINLVKWNPEHIYTNYNPITGETEYYYRIPNNVKKAILLGDPLYVTTTPWGMIEAVKANQDFKFDNSNIYHIANLSMGSMLEGLGLPPIISMYSLIFYQAILRKANEAIATEYLTPLRVVFPQASSASADPIAMMSMQNFTGNMQSTLRKHKQDPNHILIAPMAIGYQNIGGEGKTLLVSQELDQAEKTMLLGLGVSQELLSGTTNWTSSTVGLRLLENTLANFISQLGDYITWVITKIASYLGLEIVPVKLSPFELTDNEMAKELLFKLHEGGKVSTQTLFNSLGLDYNDELEKIKEEAITEEELKIEVEDTLKKVRFAKDKEVKQDTDDSFEHANQEAHGIVKGLMKLDPEKQQQALLDLKAQDEPMYNLVMETIQSSPEVVDESPEAMAQQQPGKAPAKKPANKPQQSSNKKSGK